MKWSDLSSKIWAYLKHKGLPYILENQGVSPWNNFFLSWIFWYLIGLICTQNSLWKKITCKDIRIKKVSNIQSHFTLLNRRKDFYYFNTILILYIIMWHNNIILDCIITMCWVILCRESWGGGQCQATTNATGTLRWLQERSWVSAEPLIALCQILLVISSDWKIKFSLWKASHIWWHKIFTSLSRTMWPA